LPKDDVLRVVSPIFFPEDEVLGPVSRIFLSEDEILGLASSIFLPKDVVLRLQNPVCFAQVNVFCRKSADLPSKEDVPRPEFLAISATHEGVALRALGLAD
jgi:hypothetical protein